MSSKYNRLVRGVENDSTGERVDAWVDVYSVLVAYAVTCPATAHAIKKLLAAGERGHKDRLTDLVEAGTAVARAVELEKARGE